MKRYNPKEIEPKWQKHWEEQGTYKVDLTKPGKKFMGHLMFPYPSGTGLHVGHVRSYTIPDIVVRTKRQQGFNAYNPNGWDSFGLPAENYAIKTGQAPQQTIEQATDKFRSQLQRLGVGIDWTKEINTSDPEYYRWTQWLFLQLHKHDMAYQKESAQWWCDQCRTVLANEQVVNGKCWRHDDPDDPQVSKRLLKQWFFKITDYADEMLDATDALDWTPMVKTMQKNWIGRSEGATITFAIDGSDDSFDVFTTRADTLFGATYMVLAPEHPLVDKVTTDKQRSEVDEYVKLAKQKSELDRTIGAAKEKTGAFTGAYAVNPASGEKVPIWIADYVMMSYGTGAIMAVPAHDQRDHEFAEKYDLPIRQVVAPDFGMKRENEEYVSGGAAVAFDPETQKYAALTSPRFEGYLLPAGGIKGDEDRLKATLRELKEETGLHNIKTAEAVCDVFGRYRNPLKNINRFAHASLVAVTLADTKTVETNLEDHEKGMKLCWVSAQELLDSWSESDDKGTDHYIHGFKSVVAKNIADGVDTTSDPKVFAPDFVSGEGYVVNSGEYDHIRTATAREKIVEDLIKKGKAEFTTNYKMHDWLISRQRYWGAPIPIIHCDKCGAVPVPDDQLPVELPHIDDYHPAGDGSSPLAKAKDWLNVNCPDCNGPAKRETDTMDGYVCSSWYFLRYADPHNDKAAWDVDQLKKWAPTDFYSGADHATAHLLYARFFMRFLHKIGLVSDPEPFKQMRYHALILAEDGNKMSKSKGNVVDPLEVIDSGYGADALRLYEMFIAPYDMDAPWSSSGVTGVYRYLNRVWNLVQAFVESDQEQGKSNTDLSRISAKLAKKVTQDIEEIKFNTAIAAMMEASNELYKVKESDGFADHVGWQAALETLVQVMAPFAPHMCEELWRDLGHEDSVTTNHWPTWDESLLVDDTAKYVVQVNGKVRATVEVPAGSGQDTVVAAAKANENVAKFTDGADIKKTIHIPGKLINFVV